MCGWMDEDSLFVSGFNTRVTKNLKTVVWKSSFSTTWIQRTLMETGLCNRSAWRQPGLVQTDLAAEAQRPDWTDPILLNFKSILSGLPATFPHVHTPHFILTENTSITLSTFCQRGKFNEESIFEGFWKMCAAQNFKKKFLLLSLRDFGMSAAYLRFLSIFLLAWIF